MTHLLPIVYPGFQPCANLSTKVIEELIAWLYAIKTRVKKQLGTLGV